MKDRIVFWDFDGTLAHRAGYWSGIVYGVMNERDPGHEVDHDLLRKRFKEVFPWHDHETPHPHLEEPDAWWAHVMAGLEEALVSIGMEQSQASEFARASRERFMDATTWTVYPDVVEALQRVRDAGWRNGVLSNHAPELEDVVAAVGLGDLVDHVVTSARVGYEKPHPGIYEGALEKLRPKEAWMVGDNPIADVAGAESAGIRAILVRVESFDDDFVREVERIWGADMFPGWRDRVTRVARDLHGAADIILSES